MQRTLTEQKVLKKLAIPDFRHMTKEKVMDFAQMVYRMDPEVAKAAIAQFPEYVKMASGMVMTYEGIIEKIMDAGKADMAAFCDACNSIIASLQEQLKQENLSDEEREKLNDKMIQVANMIGDKMSENRMFSLKVLGTAAVLLFGVIGLKAGIKKYKA